MKNILYDKRGIALITVYIIIAVLLTLMAAYFWRSYNDFRFSQRASDELRAHYAAEAGLNEVAMDIYDIFRNSPTWQNSRSIAAFRTWFGQPDTSPGWNAAQRRATFLANHNNLSLLDLPFNGVIEGCQYRVMLPSVASDPIIPTADGVLVKLIAVGRAPHFAGTTRKVVSATISYEMQPSPIFNYAYFINNFGWLWGGGITVNGDVRTNGNVSLNGNPRINGDIYAATNADLGAAGTITGNSRFWDIPAYHNQAGPRPRPTNPTDPANPGGTTYAAGYAGTSTRYENQRTMDMPFLGDLATYRQLAIANNGQITQGAAVLVDNIYNGNGPDGAAGTADDGTVVLIGTAANPVVINGPVVVEGDVIIRGIVSGQGTIYTGRNMHIIGDIEYNAPPSWPKPDPTPGATDAVNATKDLLGLAAKGNVVIGDYTSPNWDFVKNYLSPPFTQGYVTDATDESLGYDSDGDPTNGYWFDGNYTNFDGGLKCDGAGGTEQRRFYESSLSDDFIASVAAPSNQIRNIDAISYNNHAFTGRVGDFTVNGSIVSRDEAIIYSGHITMNYDPRIFETGIGAIDIFLPRDLALPESRVTQSG